MTTYPEIHDIIHGRLDDIGERVYNDVVTWHQKEVREANQEIGVQNEALWKMMKAFPSQDEQGAYEPGAMLKFVQNAREVFISLGWRTYLPDEGE